MNIRPASVDVTKGFITSGTKEVGDYLYVLLIDMIGQTLIKRVKSDNSEIRFTKMPDETVIETFWADPTLHTYVWIYQA